MVVLLLWLIGTGLRTADFVRLRRFWTGGARVAGGLFLTLFVPYAGLAVMGASFPMRNDGPDPDAPRPAFFAGLRQAKRVQEETGASWKKG